MAWYYRSVTFLPEHRNNEVLVGKCLKKLHGFCNKYQTNAIGVSFPCWTEATIGNRITFVSQDPMKLDFLLTQTYFREMVLLGYFVITSYTEVPADCTYVLFRRNQMIDKTTPLGQERNARRRKTRATERGVDTSIIEKIEQTLFTVEHYHSIPMSSKSTSNKFRLNIQTELERPSIENGRFTSYGLSNRENCLQSVPLI
ncbi:type I-F CRISPR-associated endoribonuclease Cas6/Csy4 [Vibrio sp. RC27]